MTRASGFGLAAGMRRVALAVCAGIVWVCGMRAQDASTPTLHVYPNMLQIPTLVVTGPDHEQVTGIAESRFYVSLDGGPKFRVTHVRLEGDDPISLAIVLDVSQPFPALMASMDDAIAGLAPLQLHAKDHVSIYAMDCNLARSAQGVPADAATLREGVDKVLQLWRKDGRQRWRSTCKEPVNLWDSLVLVTQALSKQPGRRVILAVTDGEDRGSKTSWNDLRRYVQQEGVAIFGLMQAGDANFVVGRSPEHLFNSVCNLSGGVVMMTEKKGVDEELQQFMELLRGRYIVEFPHPVDTKGGYHDMNITIEKSDALILPSGIGVPADNPEILKDPTTVPLDTSGAPQFGKRKVLPE